ncbi:MAG: DNA polymerase III subunit beta, partial [Propionibacteriales bacterium]|nr:DNA polymerase III subunit beta [Propionibacteriales bacterium]
MKFRIERDTLADAVAWTARSLPNRPSVPVLAGLLIESNNDGLTLSGFDYETSTRATLPAEVSAEGRALVSGRLLAEICKSLPNKPVDISLDGTKVAVVCGNARFSLQTMPVDEYPQLPQMPSSSGSVKSAAFATAVSQAVAAAGRDEMLPLLTGVRLEMEGSTISLMATDRFRASLRDLEWFPEKSDISANALVPARVLGETARSLVSGSDITIAIASGDTGGGLIGFEGTVGNSTRRTTTRLLEGDFPRVRQLFHAPAETVCYVDTHTFVDSVKRVALVAERNTPVRLS